MGTSRTRMAAAVALTGACLVFPGQRAAAAPAAQPDPARHTCKHHGKKAKSCHRSHPAAPRFDGPSDLVVTADGSILVADQKNQRVEVLSSTGKTESTWKDAGGHHAAFGQLYGIARDTAGNVYLTDPANHVIDKLDAQGRPVAQWSTDAAESGSFPTLLAAASDGSLYVSDHTAEAVLHLSPDGKLLSELGKGTFGDPYGVVVGPNGNLFVTDYKDGLVRELTPDGTQVKTWGDGAGGTVRLQQPEAIAIDPQGAMVVSEGSGDIVRFGTDGRQLSDWRKVSKSTYFEDPSGVALDGQGNIYVSEYTGNRVDKLSRTGKVLATWK